MNRKHKNKNKHNKPPNPVPPQKPVSEEIFVSEPKVEERLPEIIPDTKPLDVSANEPDGDFNVPKKPKRKKDEKKIEDKLNDVKNIEVLENVEEKVKLDEKDKQGENSEITADKGNETDYTAVPSSRKKKGKNKKPNEQIVTTSKPDVVDEVSEKVSVEENVKEEPLILLDSNLHNILKPETPSSKKKNKNKKTKKDAGDTGKDDTNLELLNKSSEINKQEKSEDFKDSHLVPISEISNVTEESTINKTTNSERPSHQRKNKKSKAEKKPLSADNLGTKSKQESDVDVVECEHVENPIGGLAKVEIIKSDIPSNVGDSEDLLKSITVLKESTDKVINIEPVKTSESKGNNNNNTNLQRQDKDSLASADGVRTDTVEFKNDSLQSCADISDNKDIFKTKQNIDIYSIEALISEANTNLNIGDDTLKNTDTKSEDNLLEDADILSKDPKIEQSRNPVQEDLACQGVSSKDRDSNSKKMKNEISKCKKKNKKNNEDIVNLQKDGIPHTLDFKSEHIVDRPNDVLNVESSSKTHDILLSILESKSSVENEKVLTKKKNKKNKDHLSTLQENIDACANIDQTIDLLGASVKDDIPTKKLSHTLDVAIDETEKRYKIGDNSLNKIKNIKDKQPHVEKETPVALNIEEIKDDKIKQTSTMGDVDCSTFIKEEIQSEITEINESDIILRNREPEQLQILQSINQQLLLDSNNNTVIDELRNQALTVPFNIPDTPFVVTPKTIKQDDLLDDDKLKFQHSEPKLVVSENISEKTDLKSKVMEVNKDMEELRISIEKSLAELTNMDKNEEIPELVSIVDITVPKEASIKLQVDKKEALIEKSPSDLINTPTVSLQEQPAMVKTVFSETILLPQIEEKYCSLSKDKGKGKSKKKGKKDVETQSALSTVTVPASVGISDKTTEKDKNEQKCSSSNNSQSNTQQKNTGKQSDNFENLSDTKNIDVIKDTSSEVPTLSELSQIESIRSNSNAYHIFAEEDRQEFGPIEKFEDALTSSVDDINRSFELLSNEMIENTEKISSRATVETPKQEENETKDEKAQKKENPIVTHPKNLLGHPDIPVLSNRADYKKEKNKPPNMKQAKVKIKHIVNDNIEKDCKRSQHSQTLNKPRVNGIDHSSLDRTQENEEYIYKYSFRKVFLPQICHVCKRDLKEMRVPCNFCNILFYCSHKHKDEDWAHHQALCFAISTIAHLKESKNIYGDAKNITGQTYRLLRMQAIVSCEKILKRRLVPWEQEALLYPRICGDTSCREWKQNCLIDCDGCGQISYCKGNLDHFPKSHQRWCKSYGLYQKMVLYQQTKGRLEPPLPTKVITNVDFELPEKINELLATLYEEKIDMTELQYAALTQMATAPLTAAYCHQVYLNKINSTCANGIYKKSKFVLHVVGAELQFEADSLNKWEIFFLHLKPELKELRVILVGPDLNPSNLPLDLLAKIKLCENCQENKRRVIFSFHDKEFYHEFTKNLDFTTPDLVCAFNPSLNRTILNGKDHWISSIDAVLKMKIPLCITGYTPEELPKDLSRINSCAGVDFRVIAESAYNPYASVRPDRNFISDDEMPLLFKNYCYMILCGTI